MKKLLVGVAFAFAMVHASAARSTVTLLDKDDWKVTMSGFIEADVIHDSTRSLGEYIGNSPVDRGGTYLGDNGRTVFSERNSRFAFGIAAPEQNGWKTRGYFEFDFFGYEPAVSTTAPTNSEAAFYQNPALRIRHAYFSTESDGWQYLAGQTWSLFGWQANFFPELVSLAPEPAQLFQRDNQFMILKTLKTDSSIWQTAAALERPSQRDSGTPDVNIGVKYTLDSYRAGYSSTYGDAHTEGLNIALSGTFRQFEAPMSTSSTTAQSHASASGVAADIMVPLIPSSDGKDPSNTLSLIAEYSTGTGYADTLPNWTGGMGPYPPAGATGAASATNLDGGVGGFDANGNFTLIKLQTWNANLQYHLSTDLRVVLNGGLSQISSSNIGSLTPTGAASKVYDKINEYYINALKDITPQIRLGIEYNRVTTHYVADGLTPYNDRYQFTALYRF